MLWMRIYAMAESTFIPYSLGHAIYGAKIGTFNVICYAMVGK